MCVCVCTFVCGGFYWYLFTYLFSFLNFSFLNFEDLRMEHQGVFSSVEQVSLWVNAAASFSSTPTEWVRHNLYFFYAWLHNAIPNTYIAQTEQKPYSPPTPLLKAIQNNKQTYNNNNIRMHGDLLPAEEEEAWTKG